MKLIPLKDAIEQMDQPASRFTLKFVTADRKRKTGGDILEVQGCKLRGCVDQRNATRNIELPSGQIRKVHIRLMLELNGSTIVY